MTTSASDLGPFTGLRLIHHTPTVEMFTGFERNGRRPVVLIALTEQAGRDPNWSAEFTDVVAKDATTLGPLDIPVHVSDLYGRRPWAASRIALGRRGAERILAALPGSVPEGSDPSTMFAQLIQAGTGQSPPAPPASPMPAQASPTPAAQMAGVPPPASGPPVPGQAGSSSGTPPTSAAQPSPPGGPVPGGPIPGGPIPGGTAYPPLSSAGVASTTGSIPILPPPQAGPLPPGAHNPTVPIPHGPPGSPGRSLASGPPPGAAPQSQPPPQLRSPSQRQPQSRWLPVPAAPAKPRNLRPVLLTVGAIAAAIIVLLCGLGSVFAFSGNHRPHQSAGAAPAASATGAAQPTPSTEARSAVRPKLKTDVLPVVVAGDVVFADSEPVELVDNPLLPFAFRIPKAWRCSPTAVLGGPALDGYACQPADRANRQLVVVATKRCVDACDANEQAGLSENWFQRVWDRQPQPLTRDQTTMTVEDNGKVSGVYELVLSHFFADAPGEPVCWQVVVDATGPAASHVDVQKITNDIRSQTPTLQ